MESSDLFSSLLQNPDTMQKLASMAAEVMGGMTPPPADFSSASETDAPQQSALPSAAPASLPRTPDPTVDIMTKAMPVLSVIAQSGSKLARPERIQLLTALKPFVSPKTCAEIDHAERILSMARMTKTAAAEVLPQLSNGRREV